MHHSDFDESQIIHAMTYFYKVIQEGLLESLLERPSQRIWLVGDVAGEAEVTEKHRIAPSLLNENISHFLAQGFAIDDANAPATIGIPRPIDQGMDTYLVSWGHDS